MIGVSAPSSVQFGERKATPEVVRAERLRRLSRERGTSGRQLQDREVLWTGSWNHNGLLNENEAS